MNRKREALVIGTEVAVNGLESGASLRVQSVKNILESQGYVTTTVSRNNFNACFDNKWDVVVLTSFATAKCARKARNATTFLWFDSTDSWSKTRKSLIRKGYYLQIIAYLRDLFFIWTAPKFDLITFITEHDKETEYSWWKFRVKPFVFPILDLDRKINDSGSQRLVFVGDGSYRPNQQALKFLEDLYPLLTSKPTIHVFGRGFSSSNPGFVLHGYVEDRALYQVGDIHLAPITSGAGLNLKVAMPLWNGLRVITTKEGSNGFRNIPAMSICQTHEEFAEKIEVLLREPIKIDSKISPRASIFEVDESKQVRQMISPLNEDTRP
jgi:hypothetical protein